MIDYLYEWLRYKTGKITLKEFEEQLSKFVENYKIMLEYIKQESIPDTMCGLHEAIYNECLAKEAKKILEKIGEI